MHYSTATENYPDLVKRLKARSPAKQEVSQTQSFLTANTPQSFVHHPMLFNVNIQEYKIEQEKLKQVLLILRTKNMFKVYTKESKPKANLAHYVYLNDKEVPKCVDSHIDIGVSYLALQNNMQALVHFHKCEQILQCTVDGIYRVAYHHQTGEKLSNSVYVQLLSNYGIVFYKMGVLDEAYAQFLMAVKFLKMELEIMKTQANLSKTIFYIFLSIQVHLQCCILLSESEKHQMAFRHARKAAKQSFQNCCHFIRLLSSVSEQKISRRRSQSFSIRRTYAPQDNTTRKQCIIYALTQILEIVKDDDITFQTKAAFELIQSRLPQELLNCNTEKDDAFSNLLAECSEKYDWVNRKSVLELLQLQPLTKSDLAEYASTFQNYEELIILNICYCVLSLYAMSTEARFMEKQNDPNVMNDSESFIAKSLEMVCRYYFKDSPLFKQIVEIYQKFHGIDKQVIVTLTSYAKPEDEEFIMPSKYIKCVQGGFYSPTNQRQTRQRFFVPLIRMRSPVAVKTEDSPKLIKENPLKNPRAKKYNFNKQNSQFTEHEQSSETDQEKPIRPRQFEPNLKIENLLIEREPQRGKIRYLSPNQSMQQQVKARIQQIQRHQRQKTQTG